MSVLRRVASDQVATSCLHSRLPQVFPLLHTLGASGLLIEYEDMFPYEGRLRLLRATHAYRYRQAACRGGLGRAGRSGSTAWARSSSVS